MPAGAEKKSASSSKYLKRGNAKLSDNTAVWNIPAVTTCGRHCKGCYAYKTQKRWKSVAKSWERNLSLSCLHEPFIHTINKELQALKKSKNPVKYVRVHGSGDFYSVDYIKSWKKIAEENPDIIFYAYTKRFDTFESALNKLRELPNFVLHDSLQGSYDDGVNFGRKEEMEEKAEKIGGFVCPLSIDRNKKCGDECTWCMEKENEGTPIFFIQH